MADPWGVGGGGGGGVAPWARTPPFVSLIIFLRHIGARKYSFGTFDT